MTSARKREANEAYATWPVEFGVSVQPVYMEGMIPVKIFVCQMCHSRYADVAQFPCGHICMC